MNGPPTTTMTMRAFIYLWNISKNEDQIETRQQGGGQANVLFGSVAVLNRHSKSRVSHQKLQLRVGSR